jgi:hypothetical protein
VWRELWLCMPICDRATGNWSLTRTIALLAFLVWCYVVVVHDKEFNTGNLIALGIIGIFAFSKNITDFSEGTRALGAAFRAGRRSSDRVPASPYHTDEVKL